MNLMKVQDNDPDSKKIDEKTQVNNAQTKISLSHQKINKELSKMLRLNKNSIKTIELDWKDTNKFIDIFEHRDIEIDKNELQLPINNSDDIYDFLKQNNVEYEPPSDDQEIYNTIETTIYNINYVSLDKEKNEKN